MNRCDAFASRCIISHRSTHPVGMFGFCGLSVVCLCVGMRLAVDVVVVVVGCWLVVGG